MKGRQVLIWSALQIASQLPSDPTKARQVLKMAGELVDNFVGPHLRKSRASSADIPRKSPKKM